MITRWRAAGAGLIVNLVIFTGCAAHHPATKAISTPSTAGPATQADTPAADSLQVLGRARFQAYKCYECHGANGEGTNDGPDLTGTHLNAEQIAAFLQHLSPDAKSAGMPTIAADSPDLQALVAYVLSLKGSRHPPN